MDLVLAKGQIVTVHESYSAGIGIEKGIVNETGLDIRPTGRIVDCSGKTLFPGGVDAHIDVEFELMGQETADDFHSLAVAAACGGLRRSATAPSRSPGNRCRTVSWSGTSGRKAGDRLRPAPDHRPTRRAQAGPMSDCAVDGCTSFKIFVAGFAEFDKYAAEHLRCMEESAKLGVMVNIHCDDQFCISCMKRKQEKGNSSDARTFTAHRPRSTTRRRAARPATARPGRSTSTSRASASMRKSTPSATSAGRICARPTRWR